MDLFLWLIEGGRCGSVNEGLALHPYGKADGLTCAVIFIAGWAGAILAAFTLVFGLSALRAMSEGNQPSAFIKRRLGFMTMIWAIVPPIWFWYEYWALYMATPSAGTDAFAQFKYNQVATGAIWIGILVFAAIVLSRSHASQTKERTASGEVAELEAPEPNQYVVTIFKSGSMEPKDGRAVWTGKSRVEAVTKFLDFAEEIKDGEDIKLTQEKVLRFHKISEKPDTANYLEDEDA